MKIAILGGGLTGLSASYYLSKKGHKITIFEKEKTLGGLASGFKKDNWNWYLDKTYHHIFSKDYDILGFAKEIGYESLFFKSPETASLINNYRIFPVDTPQDFLKLPNLSIFEKIRAGLVLATLKLSPMMKVYEKQSAEEFLKKTMGTGIWNNLWEEMFKKKFGKYSSEVLASFIWARFKKRTKKLGYPTHGFQNFIDYLERINKENNVVINRGEDVRDIQKTKEGYYINSFENNRKGERYDAIISTLPTPVLIKAAKDIFPKEYTERLKKLKYLHVINCIIETDMPLFKKSYWVNINIREVPIMVLVQHTNFINKKHYGGKCILYIGNYVEDDSALYNMEKEEIIKYFLPYLKKINSSFSLKNSKSYIFRSPYSQPIFNKTFINNKPDFKTPLDNFYIANLDMTYPYDRGTNYAVKLGKSVSKFF